MKNLILFIALSSTLSQAKVFNCRGSLIGSLMGKTANIDLSFQEISSDDKVSLFDKFQGKIKKFHLEKTSKEMKITDLNQNTIVILEATSNNEGKTYSGVYYPNGKDSQQTTLDETSIKCSQKL